MTKFDSKRKPPSGRTRWLNFTNRTSHVFIYYTQVTEINPIKGKPRPAIAAKRGVSSLRTQSQFEQDILDPLCFRFSKINQGQTERARFEPNILKSPFDGHRICCQKHRFKEGHEFEMDLQSILCPALKEGVDHCLNLPSH